jgi:hypothetical protein
LKAAYIDTSLLIGIRFQKASSPTIRALLKYELFSSELLIAEILAFGKRESIDPDLVWAALAGLSWVIPESSIAKECKQVIRHDYVRGADLWHLACACWLSPNPADLTFLTLDERQRSLAARIGFIAPVIRFSL